MKHWSTTRREFLRRAGIATAAAPWFIGTHSLLAKDAAAKKGVRITDHGARTHRKELNTVAIQAAIDAAHAAGGGTVLVPEGRFRTGALLLKSNVHLHLEAGSILQGSTEWKDYPAFSDWSAGRKKWGDGEWSNALLTALDATNIRIEGPGTIDGSDFTRPGGEEGFRGPHVLVLRNCRDIAVRDLTIRRAGNYALMCFDSRDVAITGVKVRGGHDGLHTQNCARFRVHDCDFRTGDDCFAGCDNLDFDIRNCQLNSSCNAFRLGCEKLVVKDCRLWGPGEYEHKISGRTNMLGAFVHFAPKDRHPQRPSDEWLIENLSIDRAQALYLYDFERGEIHVGFAPSLTVELLPLALRRFQESSPGVRVQLHDLSTQEMLRGLRDRKLDVALMIQPSVKVLGGLVFEELRRYAVCVAVHPAHPLARAKRVSVDQVARERLVAYSLTDYPEYHAWLADLFATAERPPRIAEEHEGSTSLIAAVEAGRGVALVQEGFQCLAGPRLKVRLLTPAPPPFVVGVAWRKGTESAALTGFVAATRDLNRSARSGNHHSPA
ncbi:MAG: hypothetical protein FJ405_00590 [Verrucomicrobia bacterium]|nr:hypothetical protein [Verrucomicrobiota bacterium]